MRTIHPLRQPDMKRLRRWVANAGLLTTAAVVGFLALEIAGRAYSGRWEVRNFFTPTWATLDISGVLQFDPELGWIHRADAPGFGPLGNRLHPENHTDRAGLVVLALGDSFTFGSEVESGDSWPAQLEKKTGARVINAGVGGYGIDQMILLGQRLAPIIKPDVVLLSFIPDDIKRMRLSVFSNAPKPYFVATDGKLTLHKDHVTPAKPPAPWQEGFRKWAGYSYVATVSYYALGFSDSFYVRQEPKVDAVDAGCLLLERLRKLSDGVGARPYVVAQSSVWDFSKTGRAARAEQLSLLDCARAAGISVIDTYEASRRETAAAGAGAVFVNSVGHMTPRGNEIVADMIASRLRKPE